MTLEQLYTISELSTATWFPYRDSMIRRMIKSGKLRSKRTDGGAYLVPKSAIDEFLARLDYNI